MFVILHWMKFIPHFVSKVRKVQSQNSAQGFITRVVSLGRFSNFAILENFLTDFSGTKKTRKLKVCINMDNDSLYRHDSCISDQGARVHKSLSYVP